MIGLDARLGNPVLRRLYDYWNARRGGRPFPGRADIDPLDFPYALGYVSLVDVLYDPLRFRYRLIGTNLVARTGFDWTRRMVEDFPDPAYRAALLAGYGEVVERRRPVFSIDGRSIDNRFWRWETLRLPLAADGTTIDMIMNCSSDAEQSPR
ncbi:MAG: PAS domain-containing protein [Rhodospirillales bacterium]|nr:PAS domain-containing protein [Rhodospirillales bacterium]